LKDLDAIMSTTAADSPQTNSPARLNPAALTVDELARLLSAAGGRQVSPEQVQADIDAGAPVNASGTLNLLHVTAWLAREVQARGG
jgi:hypothetical protein